MSQVEWKEYSVQELIDLGMLEPPMDGNHGEKHPKSTDYVSEGIPFVMANDLSDGTVNLKNCYFITQEQADSLDKGFAKPGDVLLTHKATLGRTAIVPDSHALIVLTPQVTYYRCRKGIYNKYLKYYFDSQKFQQLFQNWAGSGSTRLYLGITAQRKLPILLPPLVEQKRIAGLLSSLDDKIELNNKINDNLEKQAQLLYSEMFIEEPDVPLGSVVITTSGGTPNRKESSFYTNGSICWVKSKELLGSFILDTEEKITEAALNKSAVKKIPANSVMIAMYGATVGEYGIISKEMTCNQAICALIENEKYPYTYLFMYTKMHKQELINMAVGSAQQNISQVIIKEMLVHSDLEKIQAYHAKTDSLFQEMKVIQEENLHLTTLRDTLLPKLMSGEIDVENIQI